MLRGHEERTEMVALHEQFTFEEAMNENIETMGTSLRPSGSCDGRMDN